MFSYGSGLTSTMFSLRLNNGQHPFSLSNIASVLGVTEKLQSRHEVSPSIHACCSLLIDQCALSIYFDTMLAYFLLLPANRPCPRSLLTHWSWWSTGTVQRISRPAGTRACCRLARFTWPMWTPCTGGSMTRSLRRKRPAAKPSAATASQMATNGVPWTLRSPALFVAHRLIVLCTLICLWLEFPA